MPFQGITTPRPTKMSLWLGEGPQETDMPGPELKVRAAGQPLQVGVHLGAGRWLRPQPGPTGDLPPLPASLAGEGGWPSASKAP